MIRARVQSQAFLRGLAFHASPLAWITHVETNRMENNTAQDTWVLSLAGDAGAGGPLGEIRVLAAGTARGLASLKHTGDHYAIGPGRAVDLEITPVKDLIGITLVLHQLNDSPCSACRVQVAKSGLAAQPSFEVQAACPEVKLDPTVFGYPQDGAWIAIGPSGH